MVQKQIIKFKRGDTVMLGCRALDTESQPVPLPDVIVEASVRPPDNPRLTTEQNDARPALAVLDVVMVDAPNGTYELWAPDDGLATSWPVGELRVDIQYSSIYNSKNIVRSTETFYLRIERDAT